MKSILTLTLASLFAPLTLAAQWDYPATSDKVFSGADALAFVQKYYPQVGQATLRYHKTSLLGTHYNFDLTQNGELQGQKTIVLSTDKQGYVTRVFKSLNDTVLVNGVPSVAAELVAPQRLNALQPPELTAGTSVKVEVSIVDPDLRTMDGLAAPATPWLTIEDYPNPAQYVRAQVSLLQSGGRYYLANERVKMVDAQAIQEKAADSAVYTDSEVSLLAAKGVVSWDSIASLQATQFADEGFAHIMAFAHLDSSIQYLTSLGYPLQEPILFDAAALSANNSSYYVGPNAILFGQGGSPDALDADIIWHEFGHAIHYQIVPDWAYGHTGALGEGFGDYWAGAHSYRNQFEQGKAFEVDTLFNWDGYFGTTISTRSLANLAARYYSAGDYRAHEHEAGYLGDELWSTPLFQSLKQSVEQYGVGAFDEFNTVVLESMFGVGRGVLMHDLAQNMLYVANALYPDKDYQQILQRNLQHHGLLKAPFKVAFAKQYLDPQASQNIYVKAAERSASTQATVVMAGQTHTFSQENLASAVWRLPAPSRYECGVATSVQVDLRYQYAQHLSAQTWQAELPVVFGIPQMDHTFTAIDSKLRDAQLGDDGKLASGFKSYNFFVDGEARTVGDDFALRLKLNHSNMQDLRITLISPQGTRVEILNNQTTPVAQLDDYWVLAHQKALQVLRGERLDGYWRLEILDNVAGNTGTLQLWGVGQVKRYTCDKATQEQNKPLEEEDIAAGGTSLSGVLLLLLSVFHRRRLAKKGNQQ
ncbi:proconvertase P-domain protein [Vibrio metoecus]|uniref:proprotein convertase P-domain-containing protein n=1 Tax=Vibrio metoecus TaxID=1481663 RepID=UPI0006D7C007|nr:proprotein convertase P-domain-containing protein [Vibrio metoecus]KQA99056.1 proconvertase P-domain protein [Vibrio metoecus]PAR58929.1 proconvertase P-domain protein [Vibrio metoecus]PAR70114.1 proconvertase P-domain protein [Vibrio metoecus]